MLGVLQGQRRLVPAPAHDPGSGVDNRPTVACDTIKHAVRRVLRDCPHIKGRSLKHVDGQMKKNVDGRAVCMLSDRRWALCRPAEVTSSSELNC